MNTSCVETFVSLSSVSLLINLVLARLVFLLLRMSFELFVTVSRQLICPETLSVSAIKPRKNKHTLGRVVDHGQYPNRYIGIRRRPCIRGSSGTSVRSGRVPSTMRRWRRGSRLD
jgi:hypothetical protein